ncbi:MAG: RraA family protein [Pseudorhodoplanes sp.]|nr:RraA family protein [Pseudorhodoplanes sp.]
MSAQPVKTASDKTLTGKVPREAIRMMELPRVPKAMIEGFLSLGDMSSTVSDAMDEIGLYGVVPASKLRPTIAGSRICGPALTLRNIEQPFQAYKGAQDRASRLAEIEAHNLAQPGDVLVIEGIPDISNMGGISSTIAKRQGEAAAIVDGAIRDVRESVEIGFPRWASSVSPITGKWRIQTVEINGPIRICGVPVKPGDIVVADDDGVCFVPLEHAELVLRRSIEIRDGEKRRYDDIRAGVPVPDLAQRTYVYKFEK